MRPFKSTLEKACLLVEKILSWVLGSGFWVKMCPMAFINVIAECVSENAKS